MQNGSYVYHESAPETCRGIITDGEMHGETVRYVFHIDPRFSYAATFGEVHFYECELAECERPCDAEIWEIDKLAEFGL